MTWYKLIVINIMHLAAVLLQMIRLSLKSSILLLLKLKKKKKHGIKNDFRNHICLRKSEVSVERISACNVIEILAEQGIHCLP